MSIEALRWALDEGEARKLPPAQRHILLIMANRADERGYLFPSVNWICKRTGYARSTIQTHLAEMGKAQAGAPALMRREIRGNGMGGRTSDHIYLALQQPGLPFGENEEDFAPPRPEIGQAPPARISHPPRPTAGPKTKDEKKELKATSGAGEPTPVARCWETYQAGMKKRYGTEMPGSARANGMLRNLVASFGVENAVAMIEAYTASSDPWHVKVSHDLGILLRDSTKLFIAAQQRTGGAIKPGTTAKISLGYEAGTVNYLTEYPVDDAERLARKCLNDYGRKIAGTKPKNIVVVSGSLRHVFSIEELRNTSQGMRARA